MSRRMDSFAETSRESTSKFLLSVSLGHDEGLRSLESEIKLRVANSKSKRMHMKETRGRMEETDRNKWSRNMTVAKSRTQLDRYVHDKMNTESAKRLQTTMEATKRRVDSEIADFESKLNSQTVQIERGIDIGMFKEVVGLPGSGVQSFVYLDSEYLATGMSEQQDHLKQLHSSTISRQVRNEQRRGKFIREFEYADGCESIKRANEEVLSQLFIASMAESDEQNTYEIVSKKKTICGANYVNRLKLIDELDARNLMRIEEHSLANMRVEVEEVAQLKYASQMERVQVCNEAYTAAYDRSIVEEMERIIDKVLDATVWVLSCKEMGCIRSVDATFPSYVFADALSLFASPLDSFIALPFPYEKQLRSNYSEARFFIDASVMSAVAQCDDVDDIQTQVNVAALRQANSAIALANTNSFIRDIACASVGVDSSPDRDEKIAESLSTSLSLSKPHSTRLAVPPAFLFDTQAKHLLGEIIVAVAKEIPSPPLPRVPDDPSAVKIILIGSSSLARRNTADYLSKTFGLEKLSLQCAISKLIASVNTYPTELSSIADALTSGEMLSPSQSVSLVVHELIALRQVEGYKGFVLFDFPTSVEETVALLEALSGVDYNTRVPHPSDNASIYAAPTPFEKSYYSVATSGISAIFSLNATLPQLVVDNVSSRIDLETSSVVYLSNVESVDYLVENFTEGESKFTIGVEARHREHALEPVLALLSTAGLCSSIEVGPEGQLGEGALALVTRTIIALTNSKSDERFEDGMLDGVSSLSIEGASAAGESQVDDEVLKTGTCAIEAGEQEAVLGGDSIAHSLVESTTDVAQVSLEVAPLEVVEHSVAPKLALILRSLWQSAEEQSIVTTTSFFKSLCEVRLLSLVRRRLAHDVLHSMLSRNDDKHVLIGRFCDEYNQIDHDFRFDTDFKAEWSLRVLQLRDSMFRGARLRRTEAENSLAQIAGDGVISATKHRLNCEVASLLQAEMNRFNVALHLIFDFTKSVVGVSVTEKYSNELEETLKGAFDAEPSPSAGSKTSVKAKDTKKDDKKGKKGEEAEAVPFRVAVPKTIITDKLFDTPVAAVEDDKKGTKGAAASKTKKKEDAVGLSPMETAEKEVTDLIKQWSKGSFTVNRQLYCNQESLCAVVEKSIWCEAERLQFALTRVKDLLSTELAWIESAESSWTSDSADDVARSYARELASADCLSIMLYDAIEACETIAWQWFIAADAVIVEQNRRIIPEREEPIIPSVNEFFADRLNSEQMTIVRSQLSELSVQEGLVVEEDLLAWMRSLGKTTESITTFAPSGTNHSKLALPEHWRSKEFPEEFLESLKLKYGAERYLNKEVLVEHFKQYSKGEKLEVIADIAN